MNTVASDAKRARRRGRLTWLLRGAAAVAVLYLGGKLLVTAALSLMLEVQEFPSDAPRISHLLLFAGLLLVSLGVPLGLLRILFPWPRGLGWGLWALIGLTGLAVGVAYEVVQLGVQPFR